MVKRWLIGLLAVGILLTTVVAGFAVIKGLEGEKPGALVEKQSLVKVGESITVLEGAEVKSAIAVGGSVTVYGQVDEDVVAIGGSVYLKDSAVVNGDTVAVGGKVVKEAGAIAKGDIIEAPISGVSPAVAFLVKSDTQKGFALAGILSAIGLILLAIILVALFTPQLGKVSGCLEGKLLRNFWIGLVVAVLFLPVIVILAISIIGIVLIPVWVLLMISAGIFGYVAISHLLGKRVLAAFRIVGKSMMIETLVGIILLALVGLIPVVGFAIKMAATLCGLGAVYTTRFGIERNCCC